MKIGPNGEMLFLRSKKYYVFVICGMIAMLCLFTSFIFIFPEERNMVVGIAAIMYTFSIIFLSRLFKKPVFVLTNNGIEFNKKNTLLWEQIDSIIYKKANLKEGLSTKVSDLYGVHTDYRYNTLFFKTKDNKIGGVGGIGFALNFEEIAVLKEICKKHGINWSE